MSNVQCQMSNDKCSTTRMAVRSRRVSLTRRIMMFAATVATVALATASASPGPVGLWEGTLSVPGANLRIVFNITQAGSTFTATMDSPDQGAKGIPVSEVSFENDSLHLVSAKIGGRYDGTLNSDGTRLDGTWSQGGGSWPLVLKRVERVEEPKRPQEEAIQSSAYIQEDVSYPSLAAGVTLAGTLTKPKGKGPFPAVLLITGSGAQNRDEEVFGHKPFLVLADYLARHGIAVLRVDDRGVGKSTGDMVRATSLDFASDVKAGIAWLKARKDIDPRHIGLLGHSEGGLIAPMVAAESPDVAFIVLLAGTGVTGEEILYIQDSLIAKSTGASDTSVAADMNMTRRSFAILKAHPDSAGATQSLLKLFEQQDSLDRAAGKTPDTTARRNAEIQIRRVISPWFRFFLTYDPKPALMKVKVPVLAINGDKDLQVYSKQNLPAIEAALKESGNQDYTVRELPGLNHLFQTATTGAVSEYVKIEETISPTALQVIGDWILAHTKK